MPDRFGAIPEVHLFLLNDDRLLLLRRCNTDYENGNYSVIAGGVEADEEVAAAAIREASEEVGIAALRRAKEELGIGILHRDLSVVGVMYRRSGDGRVSFFLAAPTWIGDIASAQPDTCDDVSWHSLDDVPTNTVPYVRQALKNYSQGTLYEALGWEVPR